MRLFEDAWFELRNPAKTRRGSDGQTITSSSIDDFIRSLFNQLGRLLACAGVDVRAGPNLTMIAVVEHEALAHAGGGYGDNVAGINFRRLEDFVDAIAQKAPSAIGIEDSGAGVFRQSLRDPFAVCR